MSEHLEKIIQAICFLLEKEWWEMNYTKLMKLIFFADKLHLKKYWSLITNDRYVAMPKWPVASLTFDIIKNPDDLELDSILPFEKNNYNLRITNKINNYDCLSQTELDDLNTIYDIFWWLSTWKLVEMTHDYKEWNKYKDVIEDKKSIPMEISLFFENSENQNEVFNIPEDEVSIAKDLYQERCEYAI